MPERIQLSRKKGWRKPEGCVVVARPTKWGNPFKAGCASGIFDGQEGRALGMRDQVEILIPELTAERAVELYEDWLFGFIGPEMYPWGHNAKRPIPFSTPVAEYIRRTLGGKDLGCWCALADRDGVAMPCHADVLLSLANDIPLEEVRRENIRRAKREAL